uniref:Uncharacterized protein n=1 Tax=Anopheles coluzzii TaxID=1518534 RepID=A0A8W7PUA8_ANOCL
MAVSSDARARDSSASDSWDGWSPIESIGMAGSTTTSSGRATPTAGTALTGCTTGTGTSGGTPLPTTPRPPSCTTPSVPTTVGGEAIGSGAEVSIGCWVGSWVSIMRLSFASSDMFEQLSSISMLGCRTLRRRYSMLGSAGTGANRMPSSEFSTDAPNRASEAFTANWSSDSSSAMWLRLHSGSTSSGLNTSTAGWIGWLGEGSDSTPGWHWGGIILPVGSTLIGGGIMPFASISSGVEVRRNIGRLACTFAGSSNGDTAAGKGTPEKDTEESRTNKATASSSVRAGQLAHAGGRGRDRIDRIGQRSTVNVRHGGNVATVLHPGPIVAEAGQLAKIVVRRWWRLLLLVLRRLLLLLLLLLANGRT